MPTLFIAVLIVVMNTNELCLLEEITQIIETAIIVKRVIAYAGMKRIGERNSVLLVPKGDVQKVEQGA